MIWFADSSAVVKLYADEGGADVVRDAGPLVASALTRVEVVSALWRKAAMGQLEPSEAAVLVGEFEADWHGTESDEPLFSSVTVTSPLLERAAALVPRHHLRAYDAVVLASALAVKALEPDLRLLAWDRALAAAALREGFVVEGDY